MSQKNEILMELKAGKSITPMKALYKFGCFRLGARILELRQQGFLITTTMVDIDDKYFAEYKLDC